MDKKILQNLIAAIALIGLVVVIQVSTKDVNPRSVLFPRLASWAMAAMSVGLIVSSLLKHYKEKRKPIKSELPKEQQITLKQRYYPYLIVLLCVLYLLAFKRIGFEISAFLLMFIAMLLIDRREGLRKFYFAIAAPTVFILVFKLGIKLRIPLLLDRFF